MTSDVKNCCEKDRANAVGIRPWKMDADDTQLLDMMPFLEMVVRSQLPDIRHVVQAYQVSGSTSCAIAIVPSRLHHD